MSVKLTFIRLLYVEECSGGSVLGALVVLLVGVKYDGQCPVAFAYLVLRGCVGQVEHGTVTRSAEQDTTKLAVTD